MGTIVSAIMCFLSRSAFRTTIDGDAKKSSSLAGCFWSCEQCRPSNARRSCQYWQTVCAYFLQQQQHKCSVLPCSSSGWLQVCPWGPPVCSWEVENLTGQGFEKDGWGWDWRIWRRFHLMLYKRVGYLAWTKGGCNLSRPHQWMHVRCSWRCG